MDGPRWLDLFRDLGQALIEVVKAELAALRGELSESARQAGAGVAFFGAAAALGFWTLGVATYALVQLLALWLPLVGAAFAVTGLFVGLTALAVYLGMRRLRRVESPAGLMRERFEGHTTWWQEQLLSPPALEAREEDEEVDGEADEGEGRGGGGPGKRERGEDGDREEETSR